MARTDANPPMPEFRDDYTLVEVDADYLAKAVKPKQFIHIDQSECIMWWIYGIGLKGADPTWKPVEVIVGDISNANNEIARSLDDWEKLPTDDPSRGQAVASSDAILTIQSKVFTSPTDYVVTDVYTIGGGTYPKWFFSFRHDPHYALVQVQPVKPQISEAGKPPPTPVADETQPVVSVLMPRKHHSEARGLAVGRVTTC